MQPSTTRGDGSFISPMYSSGEYFDDHASYDADGPFKARALLEILLPFTRRAQLSIRSYADVGCGAGAGTEAVAAGLRQAAHPLATIRGYEVSPHIRTVQRHGIEFLQRDFCQEPSDTHLDLVTMFDVFEHVTDPTGFLRDVAARCSVLGLHIPLDDNWGNALLGRYGTLRADPGHLIYLNPATALNMVAAAGIFAIDHQYTFPHRWPSGRGTLAQKLALPLRTVLTFLHPWLACMLVGGVSLMVIGVTPRGKERGVLSRPRPSA